MSPPSYAGAADPARRALYDVEYRTIGKEDGILRWVAAKGRGVFDEAGRCKRVVGTAIDITERKLAQEEKLARQQEDAELREQFIAVLGHDLRNPLASVAAGTRFLVRRPERAAEIAEQIERSISRMSELIENVLDFARGRSGGWIRHVSATMKSRLRLSFSKSSMSSEVSIQSAMLRSILIFGSRSRAIASVLDSFSQTCSATHSSTGRRIRLFTCALAPKTVSLSSQSAMPENDIEPSALGTALPTVFPRQGARKP